MLLIQYKQPKGFVIVNGTMKQAVKDMEKSQYNSLQYNVPEKGDILIPVDGDCHISFIRELTEEEYNQFKEADEKRKKQEEAAQSFKNFDPINKNPGLKTLGRRK